MFLKNEAEKETCTTFLNKGNNCTAFLAQIDSLIVRDRFLANFLMFINVCLHSFWESSQITIGFFFITCLLSFVTFQSHCHS